MLNQISSAFQSFIPVAHSEAAPEQNKNITQIFKERVAIEETELKSNQSLRDWSFSVELPYSTTTKVIQAVLEQFNDEIPELKWKDSFHAGGTGYIDGIEPEDMTSPVMCGIDPWGRIYVAIRTVTNKGDLASFALFQRYTSSNHTWTQGGHFNKGVYITHSAMSKEELEVFKNLIKGQEIKCSGYDYKLTAKIA